MTSTQTDKICFICEEDCSNQPRTRDERGRYYHQSCYDEAIHQIDSTNLQETAVDIDIESTASLTATAIESPVSEDHFDIATSAHAAHRCNFCQGIIAADAAYCPGCGKKVPGIVEGRAKSTPIKYARESFFSSTKKTWPEIVGLTGICCGWLEILVAVLSITVQIILIARSSDPVNQLRFWELATWKISGSLVAALILIGMSWWLIRTSHGMRLKSRQSVESIRIWAGTKIALSLAAFSLTFALAPSGIADPTVLGFAVTLVWLLLWPTFILYWTGQLVIRQQIHKWGKIPMP